MHLIRYGDILEKVHIDWNIESMSNADVMKLDGQTVMALIVGAIRADRFYEGALLEFFGNRSISKWLTRLDEIDTTGIDGRNTKDIDYIMNTITIQKIGITNLDTDAIVNAANEGLWAGGGVCGAIFRAADHDQLQKACDSIGHCDTGSAVITPGFT